MLDGAPARAFQRWACYWLFGDHVYMNSVDVIYDYNSPFQWTADSAKSSLIRYTGSRRSLQTTGIHELGHGLILNHVNTEYNIMGSDFEHIHVNGSTARAYLGEDVASRIGNTAVPPASTAIIPRQSCTTLLVAYCLQSR